MNYVSKLNGLRVQAMEIDADIDKIMHFCGDDGTFRKDGNKKHTYYVHNTLMGTLVAFTGYWVIKVSEGFYYPVKDMSDFNLVDEKPIVWRINGIELTEGEVWEAVKFYIDNKTPVAGAKLIAAERLRQIKEEKYTAVHDSHNARNELSFAAVAYALPEIGLNRRGFWPASGTINEFKPTPENRIKELTKAGALIAAEIDRLLSNEILFGE